MVKFSVDVDEPNKLGPGMATVFKRNKIYTLYILGEGSEQFDCIDHYCIETNTIDFLGKDWFYDEDVKYEFL